MSSPIRHERVARPSNGRFTTSAVLAPYPGADAAASTTAKLKKLSLITGKPRFCYARRMHGAFLYTIWNIAGHVALFVRRIFKYTPFISVILFSSRCIPPQTMGNTLANGIPAS
jgi:hypothetical protein